ncbi:MAG: hypothetical protein IPQ06_08790 [Chitinophagaceae bacterium]|nr:hypothetical protein [Chitinophagaceae bacterium]
MKKILKTYLIPLLALTIFVTSCMLSSSQGGGNNPGKNNFENKAVIPGDTVVTTIARIIDLARGDMEILFNERQARYRISRDNPRFNVISKVAREAFAEKKPVKLISEAPGQLAQLIWPTDAETKAYLEWYKRNLREVDSSRTINLKRIDTASFNLEEAQQWKAFNLCKKIIPDFATAQSIFNFCKQQMCVIGPTQITPCIPFFYVRDGCFARAHKMRYIIESRYRYCSEKVFSFGNLDVSANLWGGCCVGWWYHVAPLVRVKIGNRIFCYVIDPSMFTGPVLLFTWLNAQGNTTCDATSAVTDYSIQPSSGYTPTGYPPSAPYTTDPNYSKTNTDLIYYNTVGTTCNN